MNDPKEFKEGLPHIDKEKYKQLLSKGGLNGYTLRHHGSGNVVLAKDENVIRQLNGQNERELIKELNDLEQESNGLPQKELDKIMATLRGGVGGNRKSKKSKKSKSKKSKSKKSKSRKNRRKSNRRR